jgi:hypothetical protein
VVLRDTTALIVENGNSDLTPSLPDPATVSGRMHILCNESTGTAVWSSSGSGGTPFTDDGVNVATLSVPPGRLRVVNSDGVHWVALAPANRRIFGGSAVSDASGNAVFTFTPPFPAVPDVAQAVQTVVTDITEVRVTALSASSCTVNVRRTPSVVILGIPVLGAPAPLVGATVHLVAVEPAQGV